MEAHQCKMLKWECGGIRISTVKKLEVGKHCDFNQLQLGRASHIHCTVRILGCNSRARARGLVRLVGGRDDPADATT